MTQSHLKGPGLFARVSEAATEIGLPMILMWGTLLGFLRDGGIIPHDHDIDVNVFSRDLPKLHMLLDRLKANGISVSIRTPYQITISHKWDTQFGLDIWIFYEEEGKHILCSHRKKGGLYEYSIDRSLLTDIRHVSFAGSDAWAPVRAAEILELVYGDWQTPDESYDEDESRCARIIGDYPAWNHSLGPNVHYTSWGQSLGEWPPFSRVRIGHKAPDLSRRTVVGEEYQLDRLIGNYVVLIFFGASSYGLSREAILAFSAFAGSTERNDLRIFGVAAQAGDAASPFLIEAAKHIGIILDTDNKMSRLFGAMSNVNSPETNKGYMQFVVILNPSGYIAHAAKLSLYSDTIARLKNLNPAPLHLGFEAPVPILFFPSIIGIDLRRRMIELFKAYRADDRRVRTADQRNMPIEQDSDILKTTKDTREFLAREINRVFLTVVAYAGELAVECLDREAGELAPVRLNAQALTSYRRYKIIASLNDDFEGGQFFFPEFSQRRFTCPSGCVMIVPSSIMQGSTAVTDGNRYLFTYCVTDDAGLALNMATHQSLAHRSR